MKLQIILINKGFLSFEIMMAISLFIFFTLATISLDSSIIWMKKWSINELNILELETKIMDNAITNSSSSSFLYGNNSTFINTSLFSTTISDYANSWGESTCFKRLNFNEINISLYKNNIYLGLNNKSTYIEARNHIVYLSADSSNQTQSDFFIIDANEKDNPYIISSINTGPGISSFTVAGPYVYIANTSSLAQLQILDIHDRINPKIISELKLPLIEASTTPTKANSIYYSNGYIYLGTAKWDGPEFYIIDVKDVKNPTIVGVFETNTLVNNIFVYKDIAYLATSDEAQMRIIDISNKADIKLINSFSSSGWQVQQGKIIDYFENVLALGRTVGGINRINNHEIFVFSTSSDYKIKSSHDIPGGIYGLFIRGNYIFLFTHSLLSQFQIWDSNLSIKMLEKDLDISPVSVSCDWTDFYIATGNEYGFLILKMK